MPIAVMVPGGKTQWDVVSQLFFSGNPPELVANHIQQKWGSIVFLPPPLTCATADKWAAFFPGQGVSPAQSMKEDIFERLYRQALTFDSLELRDWLRKNTQFDVFAIEESQGDYLLDRFLSRGLLHNWYAPATKDDWGDVNFEIKDNFIYFKLNSHPQSIPMRINFTMERAFRAYFAFKESAHPLKDVFMSYVMRFLPGAAGVPLPKP